MRSIFTLLFLAVLSQGQSQVVNHTIYFDSGKSELNNRDKQWLDSISAIISSSPNYSIVIWAYCDADGSEESNVVLAQRRANALKDELKANKLNEGSITANALGELDPVADNSSEAGKSKNRRALVAITYQSGKAEESIKEEKKTNEVALSPPKEIIISNGLSSEKLEVGKTLVLKNLNFEGGTPILLPESEPTLKELLQIMKDNPTMEIEIGGHVCCGPDMELSVQRARKVFNYLKGYGINAKRMTYKGYSFDKPIASESTEEGKTKNRRVEITILKL
jgi:outer membrane protein OmpA-like peptidoglycan-associated protein